MKHFKSLSGLCLAAVVACVIIYGAQPLKAQTTSRLLVGPNWTNLAKASRALKRLNAEWTVTYTHPPNKNVDVKKAVDEARASLGPTQNAQPTGPGSYSDFVLKFNTAAQLGYGQVNKLSVNSGEYSTWASIAMGPSFELGHSNNIFVPNNLTITDYTDGNLAVQKTLVRGTDPKLPINQTMELTRTTQNDLFDTVPNGVGDIFLRGLPLDTSFNAKFTKVLEDDTDKMVVARRQGILVYQVDISKQYAFPTRLEIRGFYNQKIQEVDTATDFKKYRDGVWYPSTISVNTGIEEGPVSQCVYQLQSLKVNDEAKAIDLTPWDGLKVQDRRLGADAKNVLVYPFHGRFLSEDEMRRYLDTEKTKLAFTGMP